MTTMRMPVEPRVLAPLVAAVAVLVACSVTRSGMLVDAGGRRTIPITVVVRGDSAEMSGTDPVTGERLSGLLVVDEEQRRPGSDVGSVLPPVGGGSGAGPGGTAPIGVGRTSPTSLNFRGRLEGDHGSRLECAFELQQRLRMTGEGVCRSLGSGEVRTYVLSF